MQSGAQSYFFNILIALTAEQSKVGGVEIRYKVTMLLLRLENHPIVRLSTSGLER